MPYMERALYFVKMKGKPTQIPVDRVHSDFLSWGQDVTSQATHWPFCARILLWTVTSVLRHLKNI